MLDESSLASTRQMRDFLNKIGPEDRVLVIGDTRQHQGVEAGKPFEQMQDAGMRTAQLNQIVRQRDPSLLAAVEKLSKNETVSGIAMLQQQGRLTVQRPDGQQITYDPNRLQGVSAYQEIGRDFAAGDRIQFTAPSRDLGVANRDLATIERIYDGRVTAKLDGHDRKVTFQAEQMRHFDHGYAVTSHSSQGVTAERVLVNMDTRAHPELINTRFAYVSVSRASHDAQIYTNDATALGQRLSRDASKSSAVDFQKQHHFSSKKLIRLDTERKQVAEPRDLGRSVSTERAYVPSEHQQHSALLTRELRTYNGLQNPVRTNNAVERAIETRNTVAETVRLEQAPAHYRVESWLGH